MRAIACDRGDTVVVVSGVNHWGLASYHAVAALSPMACNQDCAWAWRSRAQQDRPIPNLKIVEAAPQAAALRKDHTDFHCIDEWKDPSFDVVVAAPQQAVGNSPWEDYLELYSLDFGHYSPTITSNYTFRIIHLLYSQRVEMNRRAQPIFRII